MKLYLVRHGRTTDNEEGIIQGHLQGELSERGKLQTQHLVERFENIHLDVIYSSDLQRAYQTAQAVAKSKGLEVHTDKRFRERHCGIFQGKRYEECDWEHESMEDRQDLIARSMQALNEIKEKHKGESVAIFSHGGTIKCILSQEHKPVWNIPQENTSVSLITYGEKPQTQLVLCSKHLPAELKTEQNKRTSITK